MQQSTNIAWQLIITWQLLLKWECPTLITWWHAWSRQLSPRTLPDSLVHLFLRREPGGRGYASDKCLAWPLLHSKSSTASSQWIFAHACVASLAGWIAALSACVVTYMWLWFEAKLLLAQGFPMVMQHLFSISVICEQPAIVCRCVNQWSSCHVLQLESSLLQVSFTLTLYSGSSP